MRNFFRRDDQAESHPEHPLPPAPAEAPSTEDIARVCHEANRAYCDVLDEASLSWDEGRESAIEGVKAAVAHPDITPEQSHERWARYKVNDGWVHGEEKDPIAKTHPCLVPYEELPEAQRRKDALFLAIVRALAA